MGTMLNPNTNSTDDTELRSVLIALLEKRLGFSIDLFGMLSVGETEDSHFSVIVDELGGPSSRKEHLFDDPDKAVDCFIELRRQHQLGFDFERSLDPVQHAGTGQG